MTDDRGLSARIRWKVTTSRSRTCPVVSVPASATRQAGKQVSSGTASDPNGDALGYQSASRAQRHRSRATLVVRALNATTTWPRRSDPGGHRWALDATGVTA